MAYPRKPIFAPRGAVATSHPLAAAAGMAVLRRGGNAVDAALATATTLTVVQPPSNDIGGDLFAIVWDGERLHGLHAAGRSPAALTRELVAVATGGRAAEPPDALGGAQARGPAMPARGWLPVTVPGAPAGWRDLHDRFGSLPFAALFADAISYAEHGHPVSAGVAAGWARAVAGHAGLTGAEYAEFDRVFAPDGRAPRPGEWWRNPDAAETLRRIAATGAEDFYHGGIAAASRRRWTRMPLGPTRTGCRGRSTPCSTPRTRRPVGRWSPTGPATRPPVTRSAAARSTCAPPMPAA